MSESVSTNCYNAIEAAYCSSMRIRHVQRAIWGSPSEKNRRATIYPVCRLRIDEGQVILHHQCPTRV
jgi:hypothetical protein